MLALQYPFARIVGWELSPELTRVASENLQRFRAEWRLDVPVEALAGDATRFALPDGPLVIYHVSSVREARDGCGFWLDCGSR